MDFLPIVLGNGNIRLEVRPRISDIDPSLSVVLNGNIIPALTVRQIDTAVEMRAGQTFALGGLIQERTETLNSGLPYISDLPILGVPFRRTRDKVNEIELLVLVTPEFVDGMEPGEAPCGGPGYATTSPNNRDLYCTRPRGSAGALQSDPRPTACGDDCCNGGQVGSCGCGPNGMPNGGHMPVVTDGMNMPGGVGYEGESYGPTTVTDQGPNGTGPTPAPGELPGSVGATFAQRAGRSAVARRLPRHLAVTRRMVRASSRRGRRSPGNQGCRSVCRSTRLRGLTARRANRFSRAILPIRIIRNTAVRRCRASAKTVSSARWGMTCSSPA